MDLKENKGCARKGLEGKGEGRNGVILNSKQIEIFYFKNNPCNYGKALIRIMTNSQSALLKAEGHLKARMHTELWLMMQLDPSRLSVCF